MKTETTIDYSKFKFMPQNRPIVELLVLKKMELLQRNNKLQADPIKVTKDFYIIDGQHRFLACEKLELPVHYSVDEDFKMIDLLDYNNTGQPWSIANYVNYWKLVGKTEFKILDEICYKMEITPDLALIYANMNSGGMVRSLRDGTFSRTLSLEKIRLSKELVEDTLEFIKTLSVEDTQFLHRTGVRKALCRMAMHPNFDRGVLFKKLEMAIFKIRSCKSYREYYYMFTSIYNKGNKYPIDQTGTILTGEVDRPTLKEETQERSL